MKDTRQEIRDLKGKIMHLEQRIKELEESCNTKFNTLKNELDNLEKILTHMSCHAEREAKLIEEIKNLIKLIEGLLLKKKRRWFW